MTKKGSSKNSKFHDPEEGVLAIGRGHTSRIVKMPYFFQNLLHHRAWIGLTKLIGMTTK